MKGLYQILLFFTLMVSFPGAAIAVEPYCKAPQKTLSQKMIQDSLTAMKSLPIQSPSAGSEITIKCYNEYKTNRDKCVRRTIEYLKALGCKVQDNPGEDSKALFERVEARLTSENCREAVMVSSEDGTVFNDSFHLTCPQGYELKDCSGLSPIKISSIGNSICVPKK